MSFTQKTRLLSIGQSFTIGGHTGYKDVAYVGAEAGIKLEGFLDMVETSSISAVNIKLLWDGSAEKTVGMYIKAGQYKLGKPYKPQPFDPFDGHSPFKSGEVFNATFHVLD
jgi:hypothetical protein